MLGSPLGRGTRFAPCVPAGSGRRTAVAGRGARDVSEGPRLWERFRQKYGNGDKVTNFFFGGHSRPSDRIKNIRRELAINYPESIQ